MAASTRGSVEISDPTFFPRSAVNAGVGCLGDEDVLSLLGGAGGAQLEALRRHLDECERCQELVALASSGDESVIRDGDTILGRYLVLGELGRGGMGIVFRVHDPKLHRDLAVKVLHAVDPSAPLRLEREARALARISHPNIVTVFDIGGLCDQVCMVMELVDGSSLRKWLETSRSRAELLRVFRQAAEGLDAAHQAGLVHRDFKPENVLISADGRVKIVDFGLVALDLLPATEPPMTLGIALSSAIHRLTRTGRAVGTPAYMAPEQLEGGEADARSDQFSFAVCMWEAVHGKHPFQASTIGELRRNMDRSPSSGSRQRDAVRDVLHRALSLDPEARFASMKELRQALDAPRPHLRARSVLALLSVLGAVGVGGASLWPFAGTSRTGSPSISLSTPRETQSLPTSARATGRADAEFAGTGVGVPPDASQEIMPRRGVDSTVSASATRAIPPRLTTAQNVPLSLISDLPASTPPAGSGQAVTRQARDPLGPRR